MAASRKIRRADETSKQAEWLIELQITSRDWLREYRSRRRELSALGVIDGGKDRGAEFAVLSLALRLIHF